jgi:hypothetical protein
MGLPKTLTGQFVFFTQINNTFLIKQGKSTMLITIPSLIAAGIATAVVTGGITGTAVNLKAGDTEVVTGDQIKTEGGLHILELGHMEPWAIAMMCATIHIGMGMWGACCHKRGRATSRPKRQSSETAHSDGQRSWCTWAPTERTNSFRMSKPTMTCTTRL